MTPSWSHDVTKERRRSIIHYIVGPFPASPFTLERREHIIPFPICIGSSPVALHFLISAALHLRCDFFGVNLCLSLNECMECGYRISFHCLDAE